MIVQELNAIQQKFGYLPEEELRAFSKRSQIPMYRLHEVASFFPHYRLKPPATGTVLICRDLACHLAGASRLLQTLKATARETDERIEVGGVSCLGQCDRAPALLINDQVIWGQTESQLRALTRDSVHQRTRGVHDELDKGPTGWQIDPYEGQPRYEAVGLMLDGELSPEKMIQELELSGLFGLGGAGGATHGKWSEVRKEPGATKYIVCNADESEPAAFKDRELLLRVPHLVIEGMTLAALTVGAEKGYLYIRHEYHDQIAAVEAALAEARERGILGQRILGSDRTFELEVFISPGGYICGEQTALLEAMEDRRAEPRNRPPQPMKAGLRGCPTVLNNVETLAWTPAIALKGGKWYAGLGVNGATGMRFVSISGDVKRPGVYELPFGGTVGELIKHAGGLKGTQSVQAIAPSGPSGGFLPARLRVDQVSRKFAERFFTGGRTEMSILDLPLDKPTMRMLDVPLLSAVVVIGSEANLLDLAKNCLEFYRNESCGKCVPCRIGSQKLVEIAEDLIQHHGAMSPQRAEAIDDLATAMIQTSICGLGQVAPLPLTTLMTYFPNLFRKTDLPKTRS
jgi:NADH:ubiquinone oxidoreductase subunit F (NADH-binding)/NADH:ubiquinone oxidoreductase subunit E